MALQSITYDLSLKEAFDKLKESRQELQSITNEVHNYLSHYGNNWLFFALGKAHYQKCYRSWARVSNNMEKFLHDPKNNYTLLMQVLDHEIAKFPPKTFYAKQLVRLQQLIVSGLLFVNVH